MIAPGSPAPQYCRPMRVQHSYLMLAGLALGVTLGVIAHLAFGDAPGLQQFVRLVTEPAGKIFLRLLFVLVLPLIVSALALGVSGLGDLRALGRIGLKTLAYTVVVSSIAVLIGVAMVNAIQPGKGLSPALRTRLLAQATAAPAPAPSSGATGVDFVVGLVPNNIVKAMADGDMLAVMVFALLLGGGIAATRTEYARRLEEMLQGLYEVTMRLLEMVIRIAPFGVACLTFTLTARLGYDILYQLGAYVLTVVLALAIQQFVVYSACVAWLGGMSPVTFFRGVRDAMLTAFSTASSNATLPTSLAVAERELKLPSHVSRFVLTVGSTANQNGTALFEGV
ncbi:MAG TPA: dicarboxylate/amino acid:cation symporter, partial [Verrucomicrobiae bacterium]|nr:dicarboxylate/amino acid:cation symporter [Verrucomicrobiae bacterium]